MFGFIVSSNAPICNNNNNNLRLGVVEFTMGSRGEIPGKRKPVIKEHDHDDDDNITTTTTTTNNNNNNNGILFGTSYSTFSFQPRIS
jgi:hypothetical protein